MGIRQSKSLILNQVFTNSASHKGSLRFLHHEEVTWSKVQDLYEQSYDFGSFRGRVAVIDDTTCLSLNHLEGKLKVNDPDIGRLSGGVSLGQYYHVGLAFDLGTNRPLGLSYLKAYQRGFSQVTFSKDTYVHYEQRESHRWHECSQAASKHFSSSQQVIRISDREADSYEYFAGCEALGLDYVVRCQHNRSLVGHTEKLHPFMAHHAPHIGTVQLRISQLQRSSGSVSLALHRAQVTIKSPEQRGRSNQRKGEDKVMNVVYAVEMDQDQLRPDQQALEWILLTSLPIDTLDQVIEVIQLYRLRWRIEEMFKVLKSDALQAESTQLGSGRAIKNLITIGMNEAMLILSLKENRDNEVISAQEYFDSQQVAVLKLSNQQVQGQTQRQANPYSEGSIAWAVWIIARLGAWKGGSPPGTQTLSRGLQVLNERAAFYQFITNLPNDKLSTD